MEKYYYNGQLLEIGNYVTINNVTVCITHKFLLDNVDLFEKEKESYFKCETVNSEPNSIYKNFTIGKVYQGIVGNYYLVTIIDDKEDLLSFGGTWKSSNKNFTTFSQITKEEYLLRKAKEMYPPGTRIKNSEGTFTIATKPFLLTPTPRKDWLEGIYYITSDGDVLAMVEGTSRGCYLIEKGIYSEIIPEKDLEYYLKLAIEKEEDEDFSLKMSFLKVLKEISKDLDPDFEPKIGNTKWFFFKDVDKITIGTHNSVKYPLVYFGSAKSAQKAIEILGENIKYVV